MRSRWVLVWFWSGSTLWTVETAESEGSSNSTTARQGKAKQGKARREWAVGRSGGGRCEMKGACLTCHNASRRHAGRGHVIVGEGEVRWCLEPGCLGAWMPGWVRGSLPCLGAWVPGGEGTVRLLPINIRRRASSAAQSKEVPNHSPGPEQSKQTPSPPRTRPQTHTATTTPTHRARQADRPGHGSAGQHSADTDCSKPRRAPRPSPLVVVES
jgi:hypothetical protein